MYVYNGISFLIWCLAGKEWNGLMEGRGRKEGRGKKEDKSIFILIFVSILIWGLKENIFFSPKFVGDVDYIIVSLNSWVW